MLACVAGAGGWVLVVLTHSASCYGEDADGRDWSIVSSCTMRGACVSCSRGGRTEERKKYDDDEGDDTHLGGLLWGNVLGEVDSRLRGGFKIRY